MSNKKKEITCLILIVLLQTPLMFMFPNVFVLVNIFIGIVPMIFTDRFEDLPYFTFPTISYVFLYFSMLSVKLYDYLEPKWERFSDKCWDKFFAMLDKKIASQKTSK